MAETRTKMEINNERHRRRNNIVIYNLKDVTNSKSKDKELVSQIKKKWIKRLLKYSELVKKDKNASDRF